MNNKDILNLKDSYSEIYEKQEMQGSLLTRKGTAQNFTGGRSPFTVAEPIKQGQRSSLLLPSSSSQAQSPGQLNIPGTSQRSIDADIWSRARSSIPPSTPKERQSPKPDWDKLSSKAEKPGAPGIKGPFGRGSSSSPTPPTPPTPRTSQATLTGGAPGPRPGQTIRATGPTGNFPQLNRFVNNQSSQRMQSTSQLLSLARAGRAGVLGLAIAPTPTSSTDTPGTAPGASRYNTKDASGKIRSHLAVGPAKVGPAKVGTISQAFDKEYAKQKSSGAKTFSFKGKQYTTDSYEPDLFDVILEYLIIEGYADTNENALVIMANMSEDWRESIVEVRGGGKVEYKPRFGGSSERPGPRVSPQTTQDPEKRGMSSYPSTKTANKINQLNYEKSKIPKESKKAKKIETRVSKLQSRFNRDGKEYQDYVSKEEVDLYDVILEYLISEGYADTNENALVIMANMSEDWRESIVEVRGGGKIDPVSDIPSIGERGARSPKDAGLLMSPLERSRARVNALRKRKDPEATKRANRIDSRFVKPTDRAVNRSILAATNARSAEKKRLMQPDADKG